jgi:hypothetical protein
VKNLFLVVSIILFPAAAHAADLVCREPTVEADFKATFADVERPEAVSLSIPSSGSAVEASGTCRWEVGLMAIQCEVSSRAGDYTVVLATRGGNRLASVAPAMSMEIPTFLLCQVR